MSANERAHEILSGSVFPKYEFFLVPIIYLQISKFYFSLGQIKCHHAYVPQCHDPVISFYTSGLFPFPSYCEQSSNEWAME